LLLAAGVPRREDDGRVVLARGVVDGFVVVVVVVVIAASDITRFLGGRPCLVEAISCSDIFLINFLLTPL
jgi:hypothetical protein